MKYQYSFQCYNVNGLDNIMLSEGSQTQKATLCTIPLTWNEQKRHPNLHFSANPYHLLVKGNPTTYCVFEDSDSGSASKAIMLIYFTASVCLCSQVHGGKGGWYTAAAKIIPPQDISDASICLGRCQELF